MSRAVIKNISFEALPLPPVFGSRVIPPDRSVVVDETVANVIAQMGGAAAIAEVWGVADTSSAAGIDIVDAADNQSMTSAGAIDLTHDVTRIVVSSAGVVFTLAAGYLGQVKHIYLDTATHVGVDTAVITPTSGGPWTMATAGDSLVLKFDGTTWYPTIDGRFGVHADGTIAGTVTATKTVATSDLGPTRTIVGNITLSGATINANSGVGVRGVATISGTVSGYAFAYGSQGKLVVTGTLNGTGWTVGALGQLDLSTATLTAGSHVAPLWGDCGQTAPAGACTFADGLVLTNTTAMILNSHIYAYGKAAYMFDLSSNSSACIDAGAHGATAAGRLKIKVNGADRYVHVFSD